MTDCRSLWISVRIAIVVATATFLVALDGVNGAAAESFSVGNTTYTVHKGEDKRVFYFNTETQKSTYTDPRKEAQDERDRVVVLLAFALPFLLLLAGGGGYLMYLKVYKPEVLKPKKKKSGAAAAAKRPSSPTKRPTSPTKGAPKADGTPSSPAATPKKPVVEPAASEGVKAE